LLTTVAGFQVVPSGSKKTENNNHVV